MDYWVSYGLFNFKSHQVIWAIQNRSFFEQGEWPPMPGEFETDYWTPIEDRTAYQKKHNITGVWVKTTGKKSTYTDAPIGKRKVRTEGSFVTPAFVIGVIKKRLAKTGKAGVSLVEEIDSFGDQPMDIRDLRTTEAKDALIYISGGKEKLMSFSKWRLQRLYRRG